MKKFKWNDNNQTIRKELADKLTEIMGLEFRDKSTVIHSENNMIQFLGFDPLEGGTVISINEIKKKDTEAMKSIKEKFDSEN